MAKDFDPYANRQHRILGVNRHDPHNFNDHIEHQRPQHVENAHDDAGRGRDGKNGGSRYDNDVGEKWTRGYGDPYPNGNFDHSDKAPRFNSSKGDVWKRQPSDEGRQDGERHGSAQDPYQARRRKAD
jgi:hypothetical protein